jgi:diaminopimelate decarboxylase
VRAHPAGPRHADVAVPHDTAGHEPGDRAELDELAAGVWPRNAGRGDDGALRVAGVDVRELAETYGTPLFVLDEDDFRSRCRDFGAAYGDPGAVHYAAKAFLCGEVARWVAAEGLSLDVCSGGELAIALRSGFPAARIAMHGNNKSTGELVAGVAAGVGCVVLDSFFEIARLDQIAREHDTVQPVMIRVTVGVEAHTHEFIATAHEDQKFGFSLAGGTESDAAEAVRRVLKADGLRLVGLHSHIGSQIFDADGFEVAARRVVGLLAELHAEHGPEALESVTTLDLGGGLGIAYLPEDDPPPVSALADELRDIVGKECAAAGLAMPRLVVEPGRAIAGPGTVTLYEVGTLKDVPLGHGTGRRYVSVDGGMSDNIRTALYDARYEVRLVSRPAGEDALPPALSRVVGKHCESGDILVRDCWLPADVAPGDLLAVAATGAYCYAMASTYNRLPRPAVVAVRDGGHRVLLRRETEDDLFHLEVQQ